MNRIAAEMERGWPAYARPLLTEKEKDMQRLEDFVNKHRAVQVAKTDDQTIAELKAELAALKKKQEIESLRKQIEEAKNWRVVNPYSWDEGTRTVDPRRNPAFWPRIML